jgi:hypothetical protein
MNRVRQLCATTLLTMVLAASPALAGDMPGGLTAPPPLMRTSTTGQTPCGDTSSPTSTEVAMADGTQPCVTPAIDSVTELALGLLQSLLSLF